MFSRLHIYIYGLLICIYSDKHYFMLTKLYTYIYIYIYIYIYMQNETKFIMHKPLALQEAAVSMYYKHPSPLEAIAGYYKELSR